MVYKKCKVCDNMIACYPSTSKKNIYCSKDCSFKDTHSEVICPECGKVHFIQNCFNLENRIKVKFCSEECFNLNLKRKKENDFLKICNNCGKEFTSLRKKTITGYNFCCHKCSSEFQIGEFHHSWKGGTIFEVGYKAIKIDKKYKYEHRIIMEKHIGRPLLSTEAVHHIDGNKLNNKIENLMLMTKKEHDTFHTNKRKEEKIRNEQCQSSRPGV